MSYLLDTCIISEFTRRSPDPKVVGWLDNLNEDDLYLSVISIGEIQRAVDRLPETPRKAVLFAWLIKDLVERFGQRILPLDIQTMLVWGSIIARMERAGHVMPVMDSLIASTALQHQLILATRNMPDFSNCGVQLVNPWG